MGESKIVSEANIISQYDYFEAGRTPAVGNNISMSVTVNAETGQIEIRDQLDQNKQLGVMIGNAVRKIIIEEQRPMGRASARA